jgi:hypothetical protein
MLPQTKIHEYLAMSEKILDHKEPQNNFIQFKYTVGDERVRERDTHQEVTRKQLTHQLPWLIEPIHDELTLACEELLGKDINEVYVAEACQKIVGWIVCRCFAGIQLGQYLPPSQACL